MKVFVYQNMCCQPENDTGFIQRVANAEEADQCINALILSLPTSDVIRQFNLRAFIANDEVPQAELDHYVLGMDDEYLSREYIGKFEEVDIKERAKTLHAGYQMYLKRNAAHRAKAEATVRSLLAQGATTQELRQIFYGVN